MKYLYRCETVDYANAVDEFDSEIPGSGRTQVVCRRYEVDSETPKGAWITVDCRKKFVLLETNNKRWATPTPEEARQELINRRKNQLHILSQQMSLAERHLELAESGKIHCYFFNHAFPRIVTTLQPGDELT